MEHPENWLDCLVCGEKTRFYHLNARICRACSSFTRRILTEQLEYKCKYDGECKISNSRTSCRACRFQKCRNAGAHLDVKNNDSISVPSISRLPKPKQILRQLVHGYNMLLDAQRSIHLTLTPELGLDNKKAILAQKKLITVVEKQSLPPLISMFNEYYGPFRNFSSAKKVQLISDALPDFGVFHRAYMTGFFFPSVEDTRVMFTNGYYMPLDFELAEWFFDDFLPTEQIHNYLKVIGPLIHKYKKNFVKFKKLGIRKIDTVAMIFLSLWKIIEYADLLTDELVAYKERMMEEWLSNIRKTYGFKNANLKLAKLMHFYYESDDISTELKNAVTVLNINSLSPDKDQLCEVALHMKTLDIGCEEEETTL